MKMNNLVTVQNLNGEHWEKLISVSIEKQGTSPMYFV